MITEVFRRCNYEALELVDLHHKLPGLKARRGLTHWPVLQLMPHVLNSHSENPDITAQDAFTVSLNIYIRFIKVMKITCKKDIFIKNTLLPEVCLQMIMIQCSIN